MLFGFLLGYYPDLSIPAGLSVLAVLAVLSFIGAQLSCKARVSVTVHNDRLTIQVVRNNILVREPERDILYDSLVRIKVRGGLLSGSYVVLMPDQRRAITLFAKSHMLSRNDAFHQLTSELIAAYKKVNDNTPDIKYLGELQFKGNQFTCMNGVLMYGTVILLPLIIYLFDQVELAITLFFVFSVVMLLPFSFTFNYFALTPYGITVRNHLLFLRRITFNNEEIRELILSEKSKDNCLTIVTTDGKEKKYRGASLRDEDWLELKQALVKRRFLVTDEQNYEELVKPDHKRFMRVAAAFSIVYFAIWGWCFTLLQDFEPATTTGWVLKIIGAIVLILGSIAIYLVSLLFIANRTEDQEETEE